MQSNNFFKNLKCFFIGHDWSYTHPGEGNIDLYRTCKRCGKKDYSIALLNPPPMPMVPFEDDRGQISPIELEVGEDDVLIMSTPNRITIEDAERIQKTWEEFIEQKKKIFLVSGNFNFTVIKGIRKQTVEEKA